MALPDRLETRLAQIADDLTLNSGAAILPGGPICHSKVFRFIEI
jgi:hypothetical protein